MVSTCAFSWSSFSWSLQQTEFQGIMVMLIAVLLARPFISDSIFPHDITRYEAKKEEWRCVWTRVSSNPSVIRRIWQIGRRVSVASEGVGRARGMCWRHLDREGHGRSPFLRWTSLGLDMAHERTIHTPWNAPGAAPRVQSRQETLHTRGRRVAFRRALVGSDVAQYVGFAGRQAAPG